MARGKSKRIISFSEAVQNRILHEEEKKARERAKAQDNVLCIVHGQEVIKYNQLHTLSQFTVRDLMYALDIDAVDVSGQLNLAMDLANMLSNLVKDIEGQYYPFRIYMRNSINFHNFAMLQHCIELLYLPKPLTDLQGWILQYGTIFVFGGVEFDLKESIARVKQAVGHIVLSGAKLPPKSPVESYGKF